MKSLLVGKGVLAREFAESLAEMGEIIEAAGIAGLSDLLVQHQHLTGLVDAVLVQEVCKCMAACFPEVAAERRHGKTA